MPAAQRAREGRSVVKFKPVDVEGLELIDVMKAFGKSLDSLHRCVHEGHLAQAERDEAADRKREILAGHVGEIKAQHEVDTGRITKLAQMFGAADQAPGEKTAKPKVGMGWKEHGKIAATILGSLSGFFLLLKVLAPGIAATWDAIMKVPT